MRIVKVLSIKQPWAHLIVHGIKDIENRTWKTSLRGRILIQASKAIDYPAYHHFKFIHNLPPIHEMLVGGIVGGVEVVDCVDRHSSEWFDGPHGFVLENATPLPFRKLKGQLGFFNVDIHELYKDEE